MRKSQLLSAQNQSVQSDSFRLVMRLVSDDQSFHRTEMLLGIPEGKDSIFVPKNSTAAEKPYALPFSFIVLTFQSIRQVLEPDMQRSQTVQVRAVPTTSL